MFSLLTSEGKIRVTEGNAVQMDGRKSIQHLKTVVNDACDKDRERQMMCGVTESQMEFYAIMRIWDLFCR